MAEERPQVYFTRSLLTALCVPPLRILRASRHLPRGKLQSLA